MTTEAPVRQITIKATGNVYEVNEWTSIVDMERAEPLFFKTPHGKRETFTIHRGQLIVRNTVTFTGCKPQRMTTVYLFLHDTDADSWSTLHAGSASSIYQAKKLIDRILDSGIHD